MKIIQYFLAVIILITKYIYIYISINNYNNS